MLTHDQIQLIRSSAQRMSESDISATNLFYANLFAAAPSVRSLFPEDMFKQSEKLWESIVVVVNSVDDLDTLRPALEKMGARHVEYGAQPMHYVAVRNTLIGTIQSFFADDWTDAHADAWDLALTFVCDTMQEGAHATAA